MSKAFKYALFLVATLMVFTSCKKDEFEEGTEGDTAFTSTFSINAENYSLTAGMDDVVLQTATPIVGDSIFFESSLLPSNCEGCGPGLEMKINSPFLLSEWVNIDFEEALSNWEYAFQPDTNFISSMFVEAFSVNGQPGFWTLNQNQINEQPSTSISIELPTAGDYELSFELPNQQCGPPESQVLNYDGQNIPCYGFIRQFANQGEFVAVPGPGFDLAQTTYTWTYGDITMTSLDTTFSTVFFPQAEEICVVMEDTTGCIQEVCANVATSPAQCVTNFQIAEIHQVDSVVIDSGVIFELIFVDENGMRFSSNNGTQPSSSQILVTDVSPYTEPNAPERSLMRMTLDINCILFSENGEERSFSGLIETAWEEPEI